MFAPRIYWRLFESINTAYWPAPPLGAQGSLLLLPAAIGTRPATAGARRVFGFTRALGALLGYPLLGAMAGRPWPQAEVFGFAPDPTALATLALLLLARPARSIAR